MRWDVALCSAQDRNPVQCNMLSSLTLPFGKKETVAPKSSHLVDFFGWLQCGDRPLMELPAPDTLQPADTQDCLWPTTAKTSVLWPLMPNPFLRAFFPRLNLCILGAAYFSCVFCFLQGRQMKKPLPRSADGEDNTRCPPSRQTFACWSLLTNLPAPPALPATTIVMRWKNKTEAGLRAASRPLFIYQVCTSMLVRNVQRRTHHIVKSQTQKAMQEVGAVCWLNVSSLVDNK